MGQPPPSRTEGFAGLGGFAAGAQEEREDLPAEADLDRMTPERRKEALRAARLAPPLRGLAERVRREGSGGSLRKPGAPVVTGGLVEVQLWVRDMPSDGLARLRAAGFTLAVELRKGLLLLGSAEVEKLDELIELGFVRRVELPRVH